MLAEAIGSDQPNAWSEGTLRFVKNTLAGSIRPCSLTNWFYRPVFSSVCLPGRLIARSMPRPRFHKLAPNRQREIITAAAKVLGQEGYERASFNQILKDAGLSKGAAYYYFDGKDDLVAAVLLDVCERFISSVKVEPERLGADDFWQSIADLVQQFTESAKEEPWTIDVIRAMWGMPSEARSSGPVAEVFRRMLDWYAAILHRGRELGLIRTDLPEELLLAVTWAMDEAADRWIAEHWNLLDSETLAAYSAAMLDMFRRVLAPGE